MLCWKFLASVFWLERRIETWHNLETSSRRDRIVRDQRNIFSHSCGKTARQRLLLCTSVSRWQNVNIRFESIPFPLHNYLDVQSVDSFTVHRLVYLLISWYRQFLLDHDHSWKFCSAYYTLSSKASIYALQSGSLYRLEAARQFNLSTSVLAFNITKAQ